MIIYIYLLQNNLCFEEHMRMVGWKIVGIPLSGLWKFKSEHIKNRALLCENESFSGSAVSNSLPTHGL